MFFINCLYIYISYDFFFYTCTNIFIIFIGLTCLVEELGLTDWEMKPFPPGHVAEYDILADGKLNLVSLNRFFKIEEPLLPPVPLEEGAFSFESIRVFFIDNSLLYTSNHLNDINVLKKKKSHQVWTRKPCTPIFVIY